MLLNREHWKCIIVSGLYLEWENFEWETTYYREYAFCTLFVVVEHAFRPPFA